MANEETWRRIARQTALKVNCGWWFQVLATPLLITSLVIACAVLFARRELESLPTLQMVIGAGVSLALTGLFCWLNARKRFETPRQALVRIEASMRLRTALTAADHGIAQWPQAPELINDGVTWNWKRLLTPLIGSAVIIACGLIIPIHAKSDLTPDLQQPTAWNELDASLDQLDNQEIVQEEYIDEMREKLEKLREQSPDEWFSHSSLEATDHLQQNHQNEQENLSRNLQRAERALNGLQNHSEQLSTPQKQRLLNEYDQAVKKMQQGGMQPNKKLLKQLQNLNPEQLNQLTPEQMDQIRENMRRHAQGLDPNGQQKQPGEGEDDWMDDGEGENGEGENGEGENGEGENGEGENGEGENADRPGRGGINRGPGTAPRVLGQAHDDTGTGKHQGLQSGDLSQALPGDLLQTSDAQHDIDQTKQGPTSGGAAKAKGKGGDRVWKNSLLPNEKKALRKFFE